MVSPIVTIARPRSVSDYRAGRGANKPARKRSAGRVASQPADKRAGATTNQCAACDPIVHPTAARTPGEQKRKSNHDEGMAHVLLLELIIFRRERIAALKNRDLHSLQ